LLDLASLEERYFSVNNSYTATATSLGYSAFPATLPNNDYTIAAPTIVAATAPNGVTPGAAATYTLTATAIGDEAKDTQCLTFTLTSAGVQSATPDITSSCWH
jgi:type IV pilus assembly protein PilE